MPLLPAIAAAAPYLLPLGLVTTSLVTIISYLDEASPAGLLTRTKAANKAVAGAFIALGIAASFSV